MVKRSAAMSFLLSGAMPTAVRVGMRDRVIRTREALRAEWWNSSDAQ